MNFSVRIPSARDCVEVHFSTWCIAAAAWSQSTCKGLAGVSVRLLHTLYIRGNLEYNNSFAVIALFVHSS